MPAEWEKHIGTWVTYPHEETTFFEYLEQARDIFVQMVEIISKGETVHINVNDNQMKEDLKNRLEKFEVNPKNIVIHIFPTNDSWCRDYGAIFVKKIDNKLVATDWEFNAWGGKYPYELDSQITKKMAEYLNVEYLKVDMVLEGGSIDTNGDGIFLTTESCLLNPNRNPDKTKEEIEKYLSTYLGAEKVLWLKEGIVGDDTDGHVDDITRFVGKNKIITALEKNPDDENYQILKENFERLVSFKNKEGKPFEIITLPMPEPKYYKGERLPASYANFYISNSAVIVPTYNCPQDEEALNILQSIFKDRKVIGLDANPIIVGLGAFHCLTQQIPEGEI